MTEKELVTVSTHELAMWKVFGGDFKAKCIARGVPVDFVDRFIRDNRTLDRLFDQFDWDGSPKAPQS
jgi:hypothetical protein